MCKEDLHMKLHQLRAELDVMSAGDRDRSCAEVRDQDPLGFANAASLYVRPLTSCKHITHDEVVLC